MVDGWDPARATRQVRCERCGTTFGCANTGEPGSCWCSLEPVRLPLPDGSGPFGDCLCPACLREAASELAAEPAAAPPLERAADDAAADPGR